MDACALGTQNKEGAEGGLLRVAYKVFELGLPAHEPERVVEALQMSDILQHRRNGLPDVAGRPLLGLEREIRCGMKMLLGLRIKCLMDGRWDIAHIRPQRLRSL